MTKSNKDNTFLKKKSRRKAKNVTIKISVDGNGTVFPVKLKLQVVCIKDFRKDLMNLIETNHHNL